MTLLDPILQVVLRLVVAILAVIGVFAGSAVFIRHRATRFDARRARLHQGWSREVLTLLSSDDPRQWDPQEHRVEVDRNDVMWFLEFIMGYARALRDPERGVVEALAMPYQQELLPLLRSGDPLRRARAVEMLGQLGLPRYNGEILAALADPSQVVTMVAARALAREGDPSHLEPILRQLPRLEDWSPRYLSSLLLSFGPPAAPRLRGLMVDRGAPAGLRSVAAEALAGLNDLEAPGLAAECLEDVTDADLTGELLRLLGKLGHGGHVAVIRPFAYAEVPHVRAAALRALGALGGAEGDLALLRRGLDDPSPWVAIHAARGLRESGCKDELEVLARSGSPRAPVAGEVLQEGM
jgi:hypothetical protein